MTSNSEVRGGIKCRQIGLFLSRESRPVAQCHYCFAPFHLHMQHICNHPFIVTSPYQKDQVGLDSGCLKAMKSPLIDHDYDGHPDGLVNDRSSLAGGYHDSGRKSLLQSADSRKSLLSRSFHKLKKKTIHGHSKQTPGDHTKQEYESVEMVPLVAFETLEAQLRESKNALLQKEKERNLLNMLLKEKDDAIDQLKKQLESSPNAKAVAKSQQARPKMQRRSSLEEKRQRKRQMESAHSLGLSRSPDFSRGFQSVNSMVNTPLSSRPNKKKASRAESINRSLGSLSLDLPMQSPPASSGQGRRSTIKSSKEPMTAFTKSASWAVLRSTISPVHKVERQSSKNNSTFDSKSNKEIVRSSVTKFEAPEKLLTKSSSWAKLKSALPSSPVPLPKLGRQTSAGSKTSSTRKETSRSKQDSRQLGLPPPKLGRHSSTGSKNTALNETPHSKKDSRPSVKYETAASELKKSATWAKLQSTLSSPDPVIESMQQSPTTTVSNTSREVGRPFVDALASSSNTSLSSASATANVKAQKPPNDAAVALTRMDKKQFRTSGKLDDPTKSTVTEEKRAEKQKRNVKRLMKRDKSASRDKDPEMSGIKSTVACGKTENVTDPKERLDDDAEDKNEICSKSLMDLSPPSPPGSGALDPKQDLSGMKGQHYLMAMNRNETLNEPNLSNSSCRSRSLSPMAMKKRKKKSKKTSKQHRKSHRSKKECNISPDSLRAEFKKRIKKLIMVNLFFQQTALLVLVAQSNVDVSSFSGSFGDLGDLFYDDDDDSDSIKLPRMRAKECTKLSLLPPPQRSAISKLPRLSNEKQKKSVQWEPTEKLRRVRLMPYYDVELKKECFYKKEDIQKFRFEMVSCRSAYG